MATFVWRFDTGETRGLEARERLPTYYQTERMQYNYTRELRPQYNWMAQR